MPIGASSGSWRPPLPSLADLALFAAGVYLSIRVLAALYAVIDLWYRIGTAWPAVLGGILAWCGASVAVAILAANFHRAAFLWGLGGYAVSYVGMYAVVWAATARRVRALGRTGRARP